VKILNIYGQLSEHTDARIVGNREGLVELRDTINNVLQGESPRIAKTLEHEPLFASDGEGYSLLIERHDDDWGIKAPKDSFWNKEESNPEYTIYLSK